MSDSQRYEENGGETQDNFKRPELPKRYLKSTGNYKRMEIPQYTEPSNQFKHDEVIDYSHYKQTPRKSDNLQLQLQHFNNVAPLHKEEHEQSEYLRLSSQTGQMRRLDTNQPPEWNTYQAFLERSAYSEFSNYPPLSPEYYASKCNDILNYLQQFKVPPKMEIWEHLNLLLFLKPFQELYEYYNHLSRRASLPPQQPQLLQHLHFPPQLTYPGTSQHLEKLSEYPLHSNNQQFDKLQYPKFTDGPKPLQYVKDMQKSNGIGNSGESSQTTAISDPYKFFKCGYYVERNYSESECSQQFEYHKSESAEEKSRNSQGLPSSQSAASKHYMQSDFYKHLERSNLSESENLGGLDGEPGVYTIAVGDSGGTNVSALSKTEYDVEKDDIPGEVGEIDVTTEQVAEGNNDSGCIDGEFDRATFTSYNGHERDLEPEPLRTDVFGKYYDRQKTLSCPKCRVTLSVARYAMHIEDCMGIKQTRTDTSQCVTSNTDDYDSIYKRKLAINRDNDYSAIELSKEKQDRKDTELITESWGYGVNDLGDTSERDEDEDDDMLMIVDYDEEEP